MTKRDEMLIEYAKLVLARLEQDEDWDSDTIDYIGCTAIDMGIAGTNDRGLFTINPEEE